MLFILTSYASGVVSSTSVEVESYYSLDFVCIIKIYRNVWTFWWRVFISRVSDSNVNEARERTRVKSHTETQCSVRTAVPDGYEWQQCAVKPTNGVGERKWACLIQSVQPVRTLIIELWVLLNVIKHHMLCLHLYHTFKLKVSISIYRASSLLFMTWSNQHLKNYILGFSQLHAC